MPVSDNKLIDIDPDVLEPESESKITGRQLQPSTTRTSKIPKSVSEAARDEIRSELGKTTSEKTDPSKPSKVTVEDAIRREKKVKALLDKFDKIDNKIDSIQATISKQTKDYNFQVDISNNPPAKKAVKKIFKKAVTYIDKDMYLYAIKRLQQLQDERLDKELDSQEF